MFRRFHIWKKKDILIVLGVISICVLWGIYYYNYGEWYVLNKGGVISDYDEGGGAYTIDNEETAIAVGAAILKDYRSEWYESVKKDLVAKREGGVWTVYNEIKVSKSRLKRYSIYAGALYVQFKESGEIIRVGVE